MFRRQRLEAGVGDDLLTCGAACNRGEHCQSVAEAQIQLAVRGVHQRVGSGLHFGDHIEGSRDVVVSGGRRRDDVDTQPGGADVGDSNRQLIEALARSNDQQLAGAIIFLLTASIVLVNFVTDILLALMDPRVRQGLVG